MKAELCFPGPATPMQVASVSQQKLREASASCPNSAPIGSLHSFEASKASCQLHLASGNSKFLLPFTQLCSRSYCYVVCESHAFQAVSEMQ